MLEVDSARVAKGMYWSKAWSLLEGCTPCAPECLHCWSATATNMRQHNPNAKTRARYEGLVNAGGHFNGRVRFMEGDLDKPQKTRKPTVWSLWNDLFHKDVTDEQIMQVWRIMWPLSWHQFLVLTKRPDRMVRVTKRNQSFIFNDRAAHIWLGTTCGHPDSLWRSAALVDCPAAVKFLSIEPLLESLTLPLEVFHYNENDPCGIDWLLIGPETGPKRRPCKPEWIESLIGQADSAEIPVFIKAFPINGRVSTNMSEWPEWARRREFAGGA